MARPRLQPGEQIVFQANPGGWTLSAAYLLTLGLYAVWRQATFFTVTNQRVIKTKGWVTRSARSIPIDMIQDADVRVSLGVGTIRLSSAGGALSVQSFGPMSGRDAEAMNDAILQQRRAARTHR
jgi:membrane protein YdbS with pleckstrin-like domain